MKIHPVGAELFHATGQTDRRTDVTKATAGFCSFSKVPNGRIVPFLTRRTYLLEVCLKLFFHFHLIFRMYIFQKVYRRKYIPHL
jgi:hypothetical protein